MVEIKSWFFQFSISIIHYNCIRCNIAPDLNPACVWLNFGRGWITNQSKSLGFMDKTWFGEGFELQWIHVCVLSLWGTNEKWPIYNAFSRVPSVMAYGKNKNKNLLSFFLINHLFWSTICMQKKCKSANFQQRININATLRVVLMMRMNIFLFP